MGLPTIVLLIKTNEYSICGTIRLHLWSAAPGFNNGDIYLKMVKYKLECF